MSDYMINEGLYTAIQNFGDTFKRTAATFANSFACVINDDVTWEYKEKETVEGNCPSCGAPITGDKCEYCGRVHYRRR